MHKINRAVGALSAEVTVSSVQERVVMMLRRRSFQAFWSTMHRRVLRVMNFWSGDFERTGELDALRYVGRRARPAGRPLIVFDVGANVGGFSEACLATLSSNWLIHAFEPSGPTYRLLIERLRERGEGRLEVHQVGFSDAEREATLYSPGAGATIASVHLPGRPLQEFLEEHSETVRMTTIDAFCAERGIEFVDYLKLDIEGHELFALRGSERMLREGRIRFVQFEFGENNIDSRTYLRDIVDALGGDYAISRIVPGGLVPWSYEGGVSEIFATMNYFCERRGSDR